MKESIQFVLAIFSFQVVVGMLHMLILEILDKPYKFWQNLLVVWFAGWIFTVIMKGGI